MPEDLSRFQNLTFDQFRERATDPSLSVYERIGFPDRYRAGLEQHIWADIAGKLRNLAQRNLRVLDIGPGITDLPRSLIEVCEANGHELILVDSPEMLAQLPERPFIRKIPGRFPDDFGGCRDEYRGRVDAVLSYSVLHYVFVEGCVFRFLDAVLELLNHGGLALLGDVPNMDRRKRFFSSPAGVEFHRTFTGTTETPEIHRGTLEPNQIDDAVVQALVARGRNAGYDAFVVPQDPRLPMANRREDLLFSRP